MKEEEEANKKVNRERRTRRWKGSKRDRTERSCQSQTRRWICTAHSGARRSQSMGKHPNKHYIKNGRNATQQHAIQRRYHPKVLQTRHIATARIACEHCVVLTVPDPSRHALQSEEEHREHQYAESIVQPLQIVLQAEEGQADRHAHHARREQVEAEIVVVPPHAAHDAVDEDEESRLERHLPLVLLQTGGHRLIGRHGVGEGARGGGSGVEGGVDVGSKRWGIPIAGVDGVERRERVV